MNWFVQLRQALEAYYPPNRPTEIVGYLQGSDNPSVWRSMASEKPARQQMIVLGSIEPTREDWIAAGVAQRQQVREIWLRSLSGMIVLYGGFVRRPWGKIFIADQDAIKLGFPSSLGSWRRNAPRP
jgi:hypothetical protein